MPKSKILPIAVMAFAIVAFLLLVDISIFPNKGPKSSTTTNTQNTNTAATSKTYKSSATYGGYSFTYPGTWRVSDVDPQYIALIPADATGEEMPSDSLHIEFYSGATNVPILTNIEETTVGGKTATKGLLKDDEDKTARLIKLDGGSLLIYWPTYSSFAQSFETVVASFRFAISTADWQTYTNTKYGFTLKIPDDWVIPGGDNSAAENMSFYPTGKHPYVNFRFSVTDRTEGALIHPHTINNWKNGKKIEQTTVMVLTPGVELTKVTLQDDTAEYYLAEHGKYFYEFSSTVRDQSVVNQIIDTLTWINPNEKLVDIHDTFPLKNITDISDKFDVEFNGNESYVSVMGSKAVVTGAGKIFLYDGKIATDISGTMKNLPTNSPDEEPLYVRGLENNGKYWLIAIANSFTSYFYKFDGTTWTDLTASFHAVAPNMGGQVIMAWSGNYWLIAANPYYLVKYQKTTFTNISDLFMPNNNYFQISDVAWNGKYFIIPFHVSVGDDPVFSYDGITATRLNALEAVGPIDTLGWNGKYWLIDGASGTKLSTYDGKTVAKTKLESDPYPSIVWIKSMWLVGRSVTDAKKREIVPEFDRMRNSAHASIGDTYGLIQDWFGEIFRFDF